MKKTLVSALTTALVVGAASTTFAAANPFADVPADHWAYDAVAQLVQDGIINGYGDGTYVGDQNMSRYEMAQIVAKAMAKSDAADNNNKALIDKLAAEFSDELANLGVRVADLEAKTDNVKWEGLVRYDWNTTNFAQNQGRDSHRKPETNVLKLRLEPTMTINENWTAHARIDADFQKDDVSDDVKKDISQAWTEGQYGKFNVKLGRFGTFSDASHGLVMDDDVTGAEFTYAPSENWKVKATAARTAGLSDKIAKSADDKNEATYWAVEANYANGKWDAGVGYHNVLATHTYQQGAAGNDSSFRIADLGVGYAFDKNVKLTGDYAKGSSQNLKENAANNAYSIQLNYKGADAADAGSWGAYVAYRQLAPFATLVPTYDFKAGYEGFYTLKGWEIGADYAIEKNIVASAKYFNGKDTGAVRGTDDKATGVFTRVDFLF